LSQSTLLHITHWKAGSQWVKKILTTLCPDRIADARPDNGEFLEEPVRKGLIYPTLYVSKWQHDAVKVPADTVRFIMIRDLRDTLVSLYFSVKGPHPLVSRATESTKAVLNTVSVESGYVYLLYEVLCYSAYIQQSWLGSGERIYRYSELLENDVEIVTDLLLRQCRLDLDPERVKKVVEANRFESLTRGRSRGDEDLSAHERKAMPGDWRNHFTERIKFQFKQLYGQLLIDTGYERDLDW